MSYASVMNFTKETHVECKIAFIGLDNEVWEIRNVLKQKQRELGHSSASYVILNSHVSLLASHLSKLFQNIPNVCVRPIQSTLCHIKPSYASIALNWIVKPSQKESKPISAMQPWKQLVFQLSVIYLTFNCFPIQLVNFIDSVDVTLIYSSYIQQQQQQLPNISRICGVWGDPDVHDLTPTRTIHVKRSFPTDPQKIVFGKKGF